MEGRDGGMGIPHRYRIWRKSGAKSKYDPAMAFWADEPDMRGMGDLA